MNNDLVLFENPQFGNIRTVVKENNNVWFCLVDVCKCLDLDQPTRVKERLKEDGVTTIKVIDSLGREQDANFVNESNLYRVIFQSRKEEAQLFQDWVVEEVLPSIRKTGSYSVQETKNKYDLSAFAIEKMTAALHINDASKALMYEDLNKQFGIKLALPYLQNARVHKSATDLLKENECELKVNAFNSLLVSKGYAVRNTKGTHTFCTLTNKGLKYGENLCSPKSQGKTQIHFYTDSFKELYTKLTQD